jgi:hypothetical protein
MTTVVLPFVFSFSQLIEDSICSTCGYFYAQLFNALEWEKELVYRRQQEVHVSINRMDVYHSFESEQKCACIYIYTAI